MEAQSGLAAAARRFQQALDLNPGNVVAYNNLNCNAGLRAGARLSLAGVDIPSSLLGGMHDLSYVLDAGGLFDDPVDCYLLGCILQQAGFPHQAIEEFERVAALVPDVAAPKLALVDLYASLNQADRVTATVAALRRLPIPLAAGDDTAVHLSMLEANSWFAQTNQVKARSVLKSVLRQHHNDPETFQLVLRSYLAFGDYTNAVDMLQARLAGETNNWFLMNNEAAILIQMNQPARAIPLLDRTLALTNFPLARLNRARACQAAGNAAAAEADYRLLEGTGLAPAAVDLGLARIAEDRRQTNDAVHYYQQCLTETPDDSPVAGQIREHLAVLGVPVR